MRSATILTAGKPIRNLQERLAARNFYKANIDGSYGPMLKAAIEGYERSNRLPVTGLATEALLRRLDAQAAGGLGRVAPTSAQTRSQRR